MGRCGARGRAGGRARRPGLCGCRAPPATGSPPPLTPPYSFRQFEYLWADGVRVKKPVRLSAPEYVDRLFDWVESQVREH